MSELPGAMVTPAERQHLSALLRQNAALWDLLETLPFTPIEMWLAAGAIMQTVWNLQTGRDPSHGIHDYDLIYCDLEDLSWEGEDAYIQAAQKRWPHLAVEVRNQARVHLWYPEKFGIQIAPLTSLEAALRTWPATCHAVAVRLEAGELQILAPWGLKDLWEGRLKANPACPDPQVFDHKTKIWRGIWSHLRS